MKFIIVQHFYDLTALALAERHLKAAGIDTLTRDAFTTQVIGPEARAIGGAKLLVHKRDYVKASQLLIEAGFMDSTNSSTHFGWTETLDQVASLLPGASQLPRELRLVIIVFILISLVLSIAFAALLF